MYSCCRSPLCKNVQKVFFSFLFVYLLLCFKLQPHWASCQNLSSPRTLADCVFSFWNEVRSQICMRKKLINSVNELVRKVNDSNNNNKKDFSLWNIWFVLCVSGKKGLKFSRVLRLTWSLVFSCIKPSVSPCLVCLHDGNRKERIFLLSFIKGFQCCFFFSTFNLVSEPGFPGTSSSNYLPVFDDLSVNSDFPFGFNTNSMAIFFRNLSVAFN